MNRPLHSAFRAPRPAAPPSALFACGVLLATSSVLIGCLKEPLFTEKTSRDSKQRYGQQQMRGDSMSQTPAEQAGAAHHNDATRGEPPEEESKPPGK
jgi:hypothetical protein